MRILIIEDEQKIANSLKKGLENEGFAVDISYDGMQGFDLASSETFDLIILDLMLPNMSGNEICTSLRKKNIHAPILMLTAKTQLEDKIEGLNIGADDYLTKPFSFDELVARIRALLRRPTQVKSQVLTCNNLKLDTLNFIASRGNKNIELSKKEYMLLEYLILNKNNVVTKEMILDHVWPYDSDVLPNTVEVYIGYLRNKIEKPFKNSPKLIKTVRGFGYKIEDINV